MKALFYRFSRFLLKLIARPTLTGAENAAAVSDAELIYVLHHRSTTDLVMLDLICEQHAITSPFQRLLLGDHEEAQRMFPLLRSAAGRITMQSHSSRLLRLIDAPESSKQALQLMPVTVFWGRGKSGQDSLFGTLTSEDWAVTGRFKRLLNLFINRRNIVVHIGRAIPLMEVADPDTEAAIAVRRTARLLRVRLRQQKVTALGPDYSHRRTLLSQVVSSRAVRSSIDTNVANGAARKKQERLALKHAQTIASDMSHPTVRVLARLLRWFWTRIYDGITTRGLEHLEAISATHTLVYVPSHRSHVDYLLLSYLLYFRSFMIPHIAAGDNLNQPILGGILRRGGAFFMRRSFRGDALYAAVFNEYLYQVYRRGHSVEFFPEGGRTRSGRLLPAKFGLLKMTVDHQLRGLPKPLAFVPVYFSYEKVIEGSSYLSELRGATKKRESLADVFRNIKLIRQNFGRVGVNLGAPIELDRWLAERHDANEPPSDTLIESLGRTIMRGINDQATVNPVNLVALVTLVMTNSAIEEQRLLEQITCYQQLLSQYHASRPEHQQDTGNVQVDMQPAADIIAHVEQLGLLHRYSESFGDVLGHEPFAAVLMTWYRNNVVHTLALPSLVACLVVKRRRPIRQQDLHDMVRMIFPYLAQELSCQDHKHDFSHCVAVMCALGLLNDEGADGLSPPPPDDHHHQQLSLLANLVSHTLERMYIVIQHLSQGGYTRESLQDSSELVAQKISRLYGINAPEFSDRKLFDQFINQMLDNGIVTTLADGTLTQAPAVDQVLQAAESVIDPQIRFGVLNASTPRPRPANPPSVVQIRSTGSD